MRAQGIIVFDDYTTLVAYGVTGLKWNETAGVGQPEDHRSHGPFIKGEFWDIRSEATANFVMDLATGKREGGIKES